MPAEVGRIADAEVSRHVDLRGYQISQFAFVPRGDYWTVTYRNKTGGAALVVRVFDKTERTLIDESDGGIFEGGLTEKTDYH